MPLAVNPALTGLADYFTDVSAAARAREPHADWIDLSIGDPVEATPAPIRDALLAAVEPTSRYPTSAGTPELRAAVAGWLARRHGVEVDPGRHILPSAGSKEAVFHLPFALVDATSPRRRIVWPDPGYPVYERGAVLAGGLSHPVALRPDDGWLLDLGELPADVLETTCLAWLNYPHNPTGASVDLSFLRRQLDVARRHGIVLASDECYQELWYDEPQPSILEACDGDMAGVLAFVSLSKRSGMTGYRSGAIIGDADLIGLLRRLRVTIGTASPTFVQAAAVTAWSDQEHVEQRRRAFAAKRDVLLEFMREAGLEVSGSRAGLYLWFRAPGGDDVAYAEQLARVHVLVTPGQSFGPSGRGWLRLALVPDVDRCREATQRWQRAIGEQQLPTD